MRNRCTLTVPGEMNSWRAMAPFRSPGTPAGRPRARRCEAGPSGRGPLGTAAVAGGQGHRLVEGERLALGPGAGELLLADGAPDVVGAPGRAAARRSAAKPGVRKPKRGRASPWRPAAGPRRRHVHGPRQAPRAAPGHHRRASGSRHWRHGRMAARARCPASASSPRCRAMTASAQPSMACVVAWWRPPSMARVSVMAAVAAGSPPAMAVSQQGEVPHRPLADSCRVCVRAQRHASPITTRQWRCLVTCEASVSSPLRARSAWPMSWAKRRWPLP